MFNWFVFSMLRSKVGHKIIFHDSSRALGPPSEYLCQSSVCFRAADQQGASADQAGDRDPPSPPAAGTLLHLPGAPAPAGNPWASRLLVPSCLTLRSPSSTGAAGQPLRGHVGDLTRGRGSADTCVPLHQMLLPSRAPRGLPWARRSLHPPNPGPVASGAWCTRVFTQHPGALGAQSQGRQEAPSSLCRDCPACSPAGKGPR